MKGGRIRWKGERERRNEEREREEDGQDKDREGGTGWQGTVQIVQHMMRGRLVGPYPSHCSHVRPHLIGWFEVSLQEEDGRLDRPVRG